MATLKPDCHEKNQRGYRRMTVPLKPSPSTPLLLPHGSIRATMAIFICLTLWSLLLNHRPPPSVLIDAALLIVVFYFGLRSGITVAQPSTKAHHPWHLPRGSIRLLLILGFAYTAFSIGYPFNPWTWVINDILLVLVTYVIGWAFSWFVHRSGRIGPGGKVNLLRHLVALSVLVMTLSICSMFYSGRPSWVPDWLLAESWLTALVAFYFGWRLVS